ncbi:hypothetical protein AB0I75_32590 [Streptomyces sp. NPDC050273]|uniref:hypothetical protein n=1 Tax=Streptomyces sp. NPDC050273 TaxID=3154933 RepID=UPI00344337DD
MARASSSAASTTFVDGRNTTADSVLVARSTSPVTSQRSTVPSCWMTMTSSGEESISITSPGRAAVSCPNICFGCLPSERRVRADPVLPGRDRIEQAVERRSGRQPDRSGSVFGDQEPFDLPPQHLR